MKKTYILHVIKSNHSFYDECTQRCSTPKQLYNVGLYELRQALIHDNTFLSYKAVYQLMKTNENWCAIPRKLSNQVWKQVTGSWSSWLKALKAYKQSPQNFKGRPKMPRYNTGLNQVVYEKGALGRRGLPAQHIRLSQTDIILNISDLNSEVVEARIIPKKKVNFLVAVTHHYHLSKNCMEYLMSISYSLRILSVYALISLLTACDNDSAPAPAVIPKIAGAEMVLSSAGVGPINVQTAFNIHQITLAFEEHRYNVEQIQTYTDGNDYPIIRVSKNTEPLLIITPNKTQRRIFSVLIKDKRIGNVLGHTLGMEYGTIYTYGQVEQCALGQNQYAGKILCYAPRSGNIIYLFGDSSPQNIRYDTLPPIDALDSWKLESIIWKPKK